MTSQQRIVKRGLASAATARKLIAASQQPAPEVMRDTIAYDAKQPVTAKRAKVGYTFGNLSVKAGQVIYLVASKFTGRAYVVRFDSRGYYCSSSNPKVLAMCAAKVEAHIKAVQSRQRTFEDEMRATLSYVREEVA